ncbi:MAG: hypothetical protein IKF22_11830, partial [Lachnospiraceae bacterium]|nr:hypothetical protein [Lachnospiraceae bacterium]
MFQKKLSIYLSTFIIYLILIQKSRPPAKLVACSAPIRGWYLLAPEGALTVRQLHHIHSGPLTGAFSVL